MELLIWIVQAGLALFFLLMGINKLRISKQQLIAEHKIAPEGSATPVRFIGTMEILGSIGIVLPVWLNVLPFLTSVSALGFCVVMVGATAVHFKKKEYKVLPVLTILFVLSAAVAWYRF
ncbi:DoxX family protein [Larkinella sp. VNQ87]|uniref:DoxX family protein n=1 Tax=Larkinella sp. VNQ87 TaxID=3400921 RepID=UPI003C042B92